MVDEKDEVQDEPKEQEDGAPEGSKAEAEYDGAWDEAGKEEKGEQDKQDTDEGLPDEDESKEPPPAPEPEKETAKPDEHGSDESVRKALKDTKAHATKLAQENAEFRKKLKEFEEGKASTKEVADAKKAVTDAKGKFDEVRSKFAAIYEDYPELQDAFEPFLESTAELSKEVNSLKEEKAKSSLEEERRKAKEFFDDNIKPAVLEVHKDFDSIVKDEAYWKWAEEQSPAIKYAAMNSPDPKDINWAVTEYKKHKGADATQVLKEREKEDRQRKLINSQALRGGKTPFPTAPKGRDKNDYDDGWNESAAELKKEGLG